MNLTFQKPSQRLIDFFSRPLRYYFNPLFVGIENIDPQQHYLFVSHHTIYGVIDVPLYVSEIYIKTGIFVRGLGDHFHYTLPFWRDFLTRFGVVRGTPQNCARLMERKDNILVFPGGGREVCKRKNEAYHLIWKQRTGFARLAIEHNYPILPITAVGADHAYDILIDANDILSSRLGKMLTKWSIVQKFLRNGEAIPPIARGLGPTLIPRPERFYISFGKPIDTTEYQNQPNNKKTQMQLRNRVYESMTRQIENLMAIRHQDKDKGLLRKFMTSI